MLIFLNFVFQLSHQIHEQNFGFFHKTAYYLTDNFAISKPTLTVLEIPVVTREFVAQCISVSEIFTIIKN